MPRNISGNYTLPLAPVVSGTVIESSWANTTLNDIAGALTNSLDRYGNGGMVAPFRQVDGTVTAPALSFTSETNTGLYRQSSGVMAAAVLGVDKMTWSNVGVTVTGALSVTGTLSVPGGIQGALDVADDLNVAGDLYSSGDVHLVNGRGVLWGTSTPASTSITGTDAGGGLISFFTNGVERMRIANNGFIGIGNATAQGALSVRSIAGNQSAPTLEVTNGSSFIFLLPANVVAGYNGLPQAGDQCLIYSGGTPDSGAFFIGPYTSGYKGMRITAAGSVGIGTSNPQALLDVAGTIRSKGGNLNNGITLAADFPTVNACGIQFYQQNVQEWRIYNPAGNGLLSFHNGSTDCAAFDPSGYLFLGLNNSLGGLNVARGAAGDPYGAVAVTRTASASNWCYYSLTRAGNSVFGLGIDSNNRLVIGGVSGGGADSVMGVAGLYIRGDGVVLDNAGYEANGYRGVPWISNGGASTLQYSDRGRAHSKDDATQVTVPAGIFSSGDVVTIVNWNTGPMTIVQGGGMTMYLAGTATTGNRTLQGVSTATVWFRNSTGCVISGAGLS